MIMNMFTKILILLFSLSQFTHAKMIIENEIDTMIGRNLILGSSLFNDQADSGFGLNANFRHYMSDEWSVALGYHYLDFVDVETKDHALYVISSYEMIYEEFIPYVTGGLGVAKVSNDPNSYSKFAMHAAIGVRKYLNKNVKLNVALNLHHIPENNDMDNSQMVLSPMIGATFFFGHDDEPEYVAPKVTAPLDQDDDGVTDDQDQCPNTPKATVVNYLGCEKDKDINISLDVKFELGRADVDETYVGDLDRLALVMKKNTDLKIEVQGHTDNSGTDSYNMTISQKRADSVASYLIRKHGIGTERIKSKGYGPRVPIASNETRMGRKRNRRVEAKLMIN
jgi:OOP family OmpA-OmpF porin